MSFSLDYIREKTVEYTKEALSDGVLVTPEKDVEHDGIHPETGRDLETPSSFKEELMQTWTMDLDISDTEKSKIAEIIDSVLRHALPEDLRGFLD